MASYSISVLRNDGSSALFELQPGKITIGQQRGEIATLDPSVADPHAELHFDGTTVTYVDAGSPAGSSLPTGERLSAPITLEAGGTVCFGSCRLIVQAIIPGIQPAATAPTPPIAAPAPPHAPYGAPMQSAAVQAAPGQPAPAYGLPPAATPGQPAPAYGLPPEATPVQASAGGAVDPAPGAGVVDRLMHHLRLAMASYKKHYLNGVLTIGLIVIPAALINALVGWIPFVGVIVAIIVGVAQLVIVPISMGALGRWALATAAGQDLSWKKAWKNALKDPVQEWLNMFVANVLTFLGIICLLVPGLIVGMFALPAYLLEGKKFVGISSRSAELVMKDPGGLIGLVLLTLLALIPAVIVMGILTAILGFIPVVGEPMVAFVAVAFNVFLAPFLYLVWAQIYYATVRRLEGDDPVVTHAATIASWSALQ